MAILHMFVYKLERKVKKSATSDLPLTYVTKVIAQFLADYIYNKPSVKIKYVLHGQGQQILEKGIKQYCY